MRFIITSLLLLCVIFIHAQTSDSTATKPLQFSGYIETYYTYDFNLPDNNERPGFLYSHNQHNTFNLNLGYVKAAYAQGNIRGNLALMAGTYAQANLATEPAVMRHVLEANVGYKLSKKRDLWIDMGIMPSHIGFESAVGKDCWTLSRSLIAENSPYYETGARLSYNSPNGKWYMSALLLNGWQRIQRVNSAALPNLGTQLTFKPNSRTTWNWSHYSGVDPALGENSYRAFNNLFVTSQLTKKFGITAGFDLGLQESFDSGTFSGWTGAALLLRYQPSEKSALTLRSEVFSDPDNIIMSSAEGFGAGGFSANYDYYVAPNAMFRVEYRWLFGNQDLFITRDNGLVWYNTAFSTVFAVSF